ncbi:PAS domain S-box protein [Haloarculaceae archaeon H-GB2-1]|nr:PAS domain S-box protein [Haloarculaceae archaeon H-GB1-1]MEA5386863.1 PAS domain S-box protein [Haloarculaceae archaeon H-GB11]MEA5408338.1 PAS domain S-box protein [Haloarculaceae archaeon H-GB2-1]
MPSPSDSSSDRTLINEAPISIFEVDNNGQCTDVNPAACEIVGYSREELLDMSITDLAPTYDDGEWMSEFSEVQKNGHIRTEMVLLHKEGHKVDVDFDAVLIDNRIVAYVREITEHKEHERDLVTTKERMELALEGANLGIWDWNMQTEEVERDELLTDMLGYTRSEMGDRMRGWEEIVHPDDEKRHNEALAHHISNRTPYYQCDHRLRTKSGDWKWVRTMGKVVERDESGTPVRAVGIHQDIDERKRAKLHLQEERDIFAKGPVVVFKRKDADGWPIEYVSANVNDIFGYTSAQLQSNGVLFTDLVHDEDIGQLVGEVAEHQEVGADHMSLDPYRVLTAEGDVRWVMEYTRYVSNGDDNSYFLGYLIDITGRKEREEKYRNLFEGTRDALMLLDRNGFFDCNNQTLELFGIESVDAFVEFAPWELSPETQPNGRESRQAAQAHIEAAFEEGEAFFEWTHKRRDGTEFPAEVKLSKFRLNGEPALHALVRDITERKEYEQELQEQRDNLEILNQVVRHDIRNKLQLVLAYTDLLQTEVKVNDKEYIEQVLEAAREAVDITTTARDVTEVMLQSDVDRHVVRLSPMLESEVENVRSDHDQALVRLDGSLPSVEVLADDMLASVFRNLLTNAIQHNDKEPAEVTVSATRDDRSVLVRVADNGPGIPEERKEDIFEQGEMGLDSDGTGLGLYLVDTLVDRYGGEVSVEDNDPEGAILVVDLPIAE